LTAGAAGSSYGPATISATGGFGAYTFTLAKGSKLPSGLSVSSGGVLSGTPKSTGHFSFTIVATDNSDHSLTGKLTYTLKVSAELAINPATLARATVADLFNRQLAAMGGSGKGYTFTATGLPSWLTLSSAGLLSGTPPTTAAGSRLSFTLTVADSNGSTRSKTYTLIIDPALTISPMTLPIATVGKKFKVQLKATGGSGNHYTFKATGLPSWLKLSKAGLLSGTPHTATGSPFTITVTVTDSKKGTGGATYVLTL